MSPTPRDPTPSALNSAVFYAREVDGTHQFSAGSSGSPWDRGKGQGPVQNSGAVVGHLEGHRGGPSRSNLVRRREIAPSLTSAVAKEGVGGANLSKDPRAIGPGR